MAAAFSSEIRTGKADFYPSAALFQHCICFCLFCLNNPRIKPFLKGNYPSPFTCVILESEKMLHNTKMTAPPLMSPRMVQSSRSLCWGSCCCIGEMVTLKLTPVVSIISLEVVFTNIEKPYGGCFSVSYQGRERQRQKEGERAREQAA